MTSVTVSVSLIEMYDLNVNHRKQPQLSTDIYQADKAEEKKKTKIKP